MALQNRKIEVEVEVRGIKVKGTPLTASIKSEIDSKNVQVIGKGDGRMIVTNNIGVSRDTFKAMVTDWSGAVDPDGKELKCTAKTKDNVFEFDPPFAEEAVTAINREVEAVRSADLKN